MNDRDNRETGRIVGVIVEMTNYRGNVNFVLITRIKRTVIIEWRFICGARALRLLSRHFAPLIAG